MTNETKKKIVLLSEPIINLLKEKGNPYIRVVLTDESVQILSVESCAMYLMEKMENE